MNIPLAIVFVGLVAGLPLWAVLRHCDWVFARPGPDSRHDTPAYPAEAKPLGVPGQLADAGQPTRQAGDRPEPAPTTNGRGWTASLPAE